MANVPGEPDGGEMAPTELALHDVGAALEGISDSNRVVASPPVILRPFVFRCVIAALGSILLLGAVHGERETQDPIRDSLARVF